MSNTMLLRDLLAPYKVSFKPAEYSGKFVIEPLEKGFGLTIANSLRRVLLSSIEGAAVSCVQISGVDHEFSGVNFLKEDMLDVIANLKMLKFTYDGAHPLLARMHLTGAKKYTSEDLLLPSNVKCIVETSHICEVTKPVDCEILILIKKERGYVAGNPEDVSFFPTPHGCINFANNYSAIKRVHFKIDEAYIANHGESEKVVLDVETDGSISVDDAVQRASAILCKQFSQIGGGIEFVHSAADFVETENKSDHSQLYQNLMRSIEHLELTVRSYNCLVAANINTVYQLVCCSEEMLLGLVNFGRKSLNEVRRVLAAYNLSIGMIIPEQVREMISKNETILIDDIPDYEVSGNNFFGG